LERQIKGAKPREKTMKFWKFEYEGSTALERCIESGSLPSQESSFPGLKNTYAHPLKSMKIGDGVILATLLGDEAKIFAVGKVRKVTQGTEPPVIQWAAMTLTVHPNPTGGLVNWQTKTSFEIKPEPAKRYGLQKQIEYYVRDVA
jgi:hypothetical protein